MDKAQSLAVNVRPESTLLCVCVCVCVCVMLFLLLLKGPYPKAYMILGPYWCS